MVNTPPSFLHLPSPLIPISFSASFVSFCSPSSYLPTSLPKSLAPLSQFLHLASPKLPFPPPLLNSPLPCPHVPLRPFEPQLSCLTLRPQRYSSDSYPTTTTMHMVVASVMKVLKQNFYLPGRFLHCHQRFQTYTERRLFSPGAGTKAILQLLIQRVSIEA